jgi:anti-sigma B factor antagonist
VIITRHVDDDGAVRLSLAGELDLATRDDLRDRVQETLAATSPRHLIIDMAGVTFCDSSGMSALVRATKSAADRDLTFQVINVPRYIRQTMEVAGVLDWLTGQQT